MLSLKLPHGKRMVRDVFVVCALLTLFKNQEIPEGEREGEKKEKNEAERAHRIKIQKST